MGKFRYDPAEDVNSLGSLLSLLMCLGESSFEKIYDFSYSFEGVELFLMGLRKYNCVLQNYFL